MHCGECGLGNPGILFYGFFLIMLLVVRMFLHLIDLSSAHCGLGIGCSCLTR